MTGRDFGFLTYPTTPVGGIRTTLPTIAKWLLTDMNGGVWNNVRILQDSTVSQYDTSAIRRGQRYGNGLGRPDLVFYGLWKLSPQDMGACRGNPRIQFVHGV